MNCKGAKESMELYCAGEMPERDKASIQAHIETCKGCQEAYENARKSEKLVGEAFLNITPVINRETDVIERINNEKGVLAATGKGKTSFIGRTIVYATAASVMLVSFALMIFMIKTKPPVSGEQEFVVEREIILKDGGVVLVGKNSSIKVDESKGEVILEKGQIRLLASKSTNAIKVITPLNTVIKEGNNFMMDDNSINKVVNVYGSIELSTQ